MERISERLKEKYPNDNDIDNKDIDNIDNDIDSNNYDIGGFVPKNYREQLALETAEKFNDRRNLKLYLYAAHRLSEGMFKQLAEIVEKTPANKIKKSRGAYFNYLVQTNLK